MRDQQTIQRGKLQALFLGLHQQELVETEIRRVEQNTHERLSVLRFQTQHTTAERRIVELVRPPLTVAFDAQPPACLFQPVEVDTTSRAAADQLHGGHTVLVMTTRRFSAAAMSFDSRALASRTASSMNRLLSHLRVDSPVAGFQPPDKTTP